MRDARRTEESRSTPCLRGGRGLMIGPPISGGDDDQSSHRRRAKRGMPLALLLGGAVIAAVLLLVGAPFDLASSPSAPQASSELRAEWNETFDNGGNFPTGIAYVAPSQQYVVSMEYVGGFVTVPADALTMATLVPLPCQDQAAFYYPGAGYDVMIQCEGGASSQLIVYNVSSLHVLENISLLSDSRVGHMAFDQATNALFLSESDSHVQAVDLSNGTVLWDVIIAGVESGPPIWFDASANMLCVGDYLNHTLRLVSPDSGSVLRSIPLASTVDALVGDPNSRDIYVSLSGEGGGLGVGAILLDALSLNEVQQLSTTGGGGIWFDDARGLVFFDSNGDISVENLSTHASIRSTIQDFGPGTVLSYDPGSGTFVGAWGLGGGLGVEFVQVTQGTLAFPPYSAVPLIGTWTPEVLGIGVSLSGGLILLVGRRPEPTAGEAA